MIPQLFIEPDTVYIVGGGPSLTDFDFGKLTGRKHIAVNTAFRKCHTADAVFFIDQDFYRQHGNSFWRYGQKKHGHILTTYQGDLNDEHRDRRISVLPTMPKAIFSTNPDKLGRKSNSGVMAINLAYLAGARNIVLLGMDGKQVSGRSNWHSGTTMQHRRQATPKGFERMNQDFAELAEAIRTKKLPLQITNASADSAIDVFPKISLAEAFPSTPNQR